MDKYVSIDYLKSKGHYWLDNDSSADRTYVMDLKILDNIPENEFCLDKESTCKKCLNCGKLIVANYYNFCPNCGAPFTNNEDKYHE